MAEWFKAAVLKTVGSETGPGVRIPLSPPAFARLRRASARPALRAGRSADFHRRHMRHPSKTALTAIVVLVATTLLMGQGNFEKLKDPAQLNERAPGQYRARF